MKLSDLLLTLNIELKGEDKEVTEIVNFGNQIQKDCIFVCIKGSRFDSHSLIQTALAKGAAAVIVEENFILEDQSKIYYYANTRKAFSILCFANAGDIQNTVDIIGVTGTNGKTTVTAIIKHILATQGIKAGLIGTIKNCIGEDCQKSFTTTPEPIMLAKLLTKMKEKNCREIVLEASSQALSQCRLEPFKFKVAAFTNFSQDHLDYHKTMDQYFAAKMKLFTQSRLCVLNCDDEEIMKIPHIIECDYKTFSLKNRNADFFATEIGYSHCNVSFVACYRNYQKRKVEKVGVCFQMPGEYSVYNAICALAVCVCDGLDFKKSAKSLATFGGIKGRSQHIKTDKGFEILIDYAHTPQGLDKMLSAVKKGARGRLILVFGCGGNRDKSKRPQMGKAACKNADYIFLTSDNPRSEDPYEIIQDIEEEMKMYDVPYEVYVDRYIAIESAISLAKKDDVIVLAGKGHEDYQIINGTIIEFNEEKIVEEILNNNSQF